MRSTAKLVLVGLLALTPALYPIDLSGLDLGGIDPLKITEILTKGVKSFSDVPVEKEVAIGRDVSAGLLGTMPLVDDPAAQTYVNGIGRWLALQTERPDLPWTFGVIDTDTVNAFAAPGGYVFVTRGLFVMLRNEAELAGVLGHEIAHVLRRHHLQAIESRLRTEVAADVAGMLVEYDSDAVDVLVDAGMEVYAKGLDREDELEADRMGVVVAARSGYDPYGLPAMLLSLYERDSNDQALAFLVSTHPPAGDRLRQLDEAMAGTLDAYSGAVGQTRRFQDVRKRLLEDH